MIPVRLIEEKNKNKRKTSERNSIKENSTNAHLLSREAVVVEVVLWAKVEQTHYCYSDSTAVDMYFDNTYSYCIDPIGSIADLHCVVVVAVENKTNSTMMSSCYLHSPRELGCAEPDKSPPRCRMNSYCFDCSVEAGDNRQRHHCYCTEDHYC